MRVYGSPRLPDNHYFPALSYEVSFKYPITSHFIVIHVGWWTPQARAEAGLWRYRAGMVRLFGAGSFDVAPMGSHGRQQNHDDQRDCD